MTARRVWTIDEVLQLPATVDVTTAGQILGIGRNLAHELVKDGKFPVPVLRLGTKLRVPTAGLRRALGIDDVARAS